MIRYIKASLVIIGLLLCNVVSAADVVQIHTNQEVYSNGDQLHFSVQFSAQENWQSVSVINCSLTNSKGSYTATQSLKVKAGMSSGTFKIPIELAADWYYLTVEVKEYLKGKPLLISEKRIAIYNDYALPSQLTDWTAEENADQTAQNASAIQVSSGGTYAVAIKSQLLAKVESQVAEYVATPSLSTQVFGAPDSSQEEFLLTGQIMDPSTGSPRQASGLVLIDRDDCSLEYFDTDNEGNFAVTIKPFDSERTYQVASLFGETVNVKAALPELSNRMVKPLLYTAEIVAYLKQSKQRKLIGQIYSKAEIDAPKTEAKRSPIVDRKLQVDNYVLFEDVYTFLKEVSSPIKVKKEKGIPTLRILNSDRKALFPKEPQIIIDGKLVANSKALFALPVKDVDRFEIVQLGSTIRRNYGSLGNNGLLFVYTKEGNYSNGLDDTFSYSGMTSVPTIETIDQSALNQKINLSPSLFWVVNQITSDGSLQLDWNKPKFDKAVKVSVMGRDDAGALITKEMMMTIK